MAKIRADQLLVVKNLCESRSKAQALILAGKVWIGTARVEKAGRLLPEETELRVESPPPFVSRSGEKLDGLFRSWPGEEFRPIGIWLDVGASTGGFTDCLLQRGAEKVVCVDVGRCQLHSKILQDPRVINLEGVNARHLKPGDLPEAPYNGVVIDVSFISLTLILKPVWAFLKPGGWLCALIKPQFEVQKAEADKARGIITDETLRQAVLEKIRQFVRNELPNTNEFLVTESTLAGTEGNREFLAAWQKTVE